MVERIGGINRGHEHHGYAGRTDLDEVHVYRLEDTYPETDAVTGAHRLDFFTLIWFEDSDDARVTIDGEEHVGMSGTVACSSPASVVGWTRGRAQRGVIVHFTDRFLAPSAVDVVLQFPMFAPDTPAVYELPGDHRARGMFDDLVVSFDERISARADVVHHQLVALLLHLDATLARPGLPRRSLEVDDRLAHEFRLAVADSAGVIRSVAEHAAALGVSPDRLARATRRVLGRSPRQVIAERQVRDAMTLLATTDLAVGQIGRRLGFVESSAFSRAFSRHVGVAPSVWRREHRGTDGS